MNKKGRPIAFKRMPTSEARSCFARVVSGARRGERTVLSYHGKNVAAVVPVEDLALLQAIEDRRDARAAKLALEDVAKNGAVPWEKVKAELGL